MSRHTDGPWTIVPYGTHQARIYGNVEGGPVAVVQYCVNDGTDLDRANARLIASAPELLEAATLARNSLRCTVAKEDRNPLVNYMSECGCAFHALNRVVEKIKGRQ